MTFEFSVGIDTDPSIRLRRLVSATIATALPFWLLLQPTLSYSQAAPGAGQLLQTVPQQAPRAPLDLQLELRLRQSKSLTDVEGMRIEVKGFRLVGLSLVPEADVQKVLAPFLGGNRNFQTLIDAAAKVKEFLAQRGYFLANAIISEQKIVDGVVEILVLEGKLGKVKVEYDQDVEINRRLVESYAAQLQEGSFISASAVERALFLISDMKGIQVRSVFEPGATVGSSDLTIKVSRTKIAEANLDLDANGSIYTGIFRAGAGADLNNPFKRGDLLSFRYTRALDELQPASLQFTRVSYLTPIGSWGTKIGGSFADLKYKLGTPIFEALQASGAAEVRSVIGIHPLIRSRNANLLLSYQFDDRRFHDIQETTSRMSDKTTALSTYGLSGDYRDPLFGGGINVYNIAQTAGRLAFATDALRTGDQAGHFTAGNYRKVNFTYSRLQSLVDRIALYFSYSTQLSSKNLDPSEKFSLGGPSSIRAYPQGEGAGDEGYFGTVEARFRLPSSEKIPGTMVVTLFHDFGWSRVNKNPLEADTVNTRKLAGAGVGLNWEVPGDWALRTSVAFQQTAAPLSENVARDPHVYFLFTKYF